MILWAVANKERFIPRRSAYYLDDSDIDMPVGRPQERKAVVILFGEDREDVKRRAASELGGNPDRYIVEPLTSRDDRVIVKLQFDQGG